MQWSAHLRQSGGVCVPFRQLISVYLRLKLGGASLGSVVVHLHLRQSVVVHVYLIGCMVVHVHLKQCTCTWWCVYSSVVVHEYTL